MTQLNNVRDENKISAALEETLMLGVIAAMLGALLCRLLSEQTSFPGGNDIDQCG